MLCGRDAPAAPQPHRTGPGQACGLGWRHAEGTPAPPPPLREALMMKRLCNEIQENLGLPDAAKERFLLHAFLSKRV